MELDSLADTLTGWREHIATVSGARRDPRGTIAVGVTDREKSIQVMSYLAERGISCAELTKDGPQGGRDVHVGTMHRFKGLEYQRLALVGINDGALPRADMMERYRTADPQRYRREDRKARSLLFVAVTRARDALRITWSARPSRYLAIR